MQFYTVEEVAAMTKLSKRWLWVQCREGKVAHHKWGRSYRFSETDLLQFIAESRVQPQPADPLADLVPVGRGRRRVSPPR